MQYTNRMLETQIHLNNIVQSNEKIDKTRTKENGKKNDQTKRIKSLKKMGTLETNRAFIFKQLYMNNCII